jgi:hypothetical protein
MDEQNHFIPADDTDANTQPTPEIKNDSIAWTASEFIDNSKNFNWYLVFFISILAISALVFLFTHSIFSAVAIFILGVAVSYMATRKPREVNYSVDGSGIMINKTDYPFSEFKSYSLVSESGLEHIILVSVKRFSPNKTIYFEPQDKDRIISLLGKFLPLEAVSNDPIDKLMKKIGL